MPVLRHSPLPAVQTYETDDELIVEIDLPTEEPHLRAELRGRILRLVIARPPETAA